MESIVTSTGPWVGFIGTVGLTLVTYLARNFLLPYLKTGNRVRYAQYISAISDDITDDLKVRYPNNEWLEHLDEAVDKITEVCEISPEIARRATRAAASRK